MADEDLIPHGGRLIPRDRAIETLRTHWAVAAVDPARMQDAHQAAARLYIEHNLGEQLQPSDPTAAVADAELLIRDVAFAYEIAASEEMGGLIRPTASRTGESSGLAEAAAYQAFELLRALPLDNGSLEGLVRQVLQLGALAYCSDRWAEYRAWLRDRNVTPEIFSPGRSWDTRVLSDLGQIWVRLLRKDGWSDLQGVAEIVTRLRDEQRENEDLLFASATHPNELKATGWRLVALYHWAKLSELVATYLMQGTPSDIVTHIEFHFDRSISAAQQSADPPFTVVLQWQRAMVHRMISGALWTVTRIGGSAQESTRSSSPWSRICSAQREGKG